MNGLALQMVALKVDQIATYKGNQITMAVIAVFEAIFIMQPQKSFKKAKNED